MSEYNFENVTGIIYEKIMNCDENISNTFSIIQ